MLGLFHLTITSSSIHAVTKDTISFISMAELHATMYMYHISFIRSSADEKFSFKVFVYFSIHANTSSGEPWHF